MKRIIGVLSFIIVLGLQVYAVHAEQLVTLTITEAQINQRLTELLRSSNADDTNASFVIEGGQLSLKGTLAINPGESEPYTFSLRVYVSRSKLACAFTAAKFGKRVATADDLHYLNIGANETCDQIFGPFLAAYPNAQVTGVLLANHTMTVRLRQVGEPVAAGCTATMLNSVNLRTDPGATASVITALAPGTTLNVVGTQDDWLQVSYHGSSGWVYAPLVAQSCK